MQRAQLGVVALVRLVEAVAVHQEPADFALVFVFVQVIQNDVGAVVHHVVLDDDACDFILGERTDERILALE